MTSPATNLATAAADELAREAASPTGQEAIESVRETILQSLLDMKQHKTTSLCALGNAGITASLLVMLVPWTFEPTRAAVISDALHVGAVMLLAGVGYLSLHIGKCAALMGGGAR